MCSGQPDAPSASTKHIVVVGAGPVGLLATIFLLRRNLHPANPSNTANPTANPNNSANTANQTNPTNHSNRTTYRVTLIDPGVDFGTLDSCGLHRARSWMIGLSVHGLDAVRRIPDLYEKYVRELGIDITGAVIGLNRRIKIKSKNKHSRTGLKGLKESSFTVDRNYICAALSRYLNDHFGEDERFTSLYGTRALYVDGENRTLVVRGANGDTTISYDILLGCDGVRSVVRNAFLTKHRDFEFDSRGAFSRGKAVHVALPADVDEGTFFFLNEALPGMFAFVLPETGKKINVNVGVSLNKTIPEELMSEDPNIVAEYVMQHWHAFDIDAEDFGRQWVDQGWSTFSQAHCNFYHSLELSALLLGDAAHATTPQIGQGMNTALADAAVLNDLLDEHKDNWNAVLPKFSKLRVKEGNALTDLSFHSFSLDARHQLILLFRQTVRGFLHRRLPWLVDPNPMNEIRKGMKLSEAYDGMHKLGIIQKSRYVNDTIMRDHFEESVGMVTRKGKKGILNELLIWGVYVAAIAVAANFFISFLLHPSPGECSLE